MNGYLSLTALCLGFFLDLLLGDPYSLPHPIRAIGSLITNTEHLLRKLFFIPKPEQKRSSHAVFRELTAGVILWLIVVSLSVLLPLSLLHILYNLHWSIGMITEGILCYYMLAAKSLKTESMKVAYALEKKDIEGARSAVSMIVGRDTKPLSEEGIAKAAVETVAENTSDGEIAPFLFMLCFGACGGFFYKAANTLDSMVGYHNETYLYFGRFSARMDDVLNFLPSRISACLMLLAVWILQFLQTFSTAHIKNPRKKEKKQNMITYPAFSAKNALRIFLRDRKKHQSPNSAQTEAVCAGALNLTLAGDAWYFGKRYKKPFIGDGTDTAAGCHITAACLLLYLTSWLCFIFGILLKLSIGQISFILSK